MSRRWKILVAGATIIATAIPGTPPAAAALPAGGMSAAALNTLFNAYGNTSGRWSGADSTASVLLPDGRAAWLFSDTFLGTVNADFSRPTTSPFINNSIVVQDGTSLVATLHGGTVSAPESLVRATQAGEFYWVGDGTVDGGALRVLYNRYRRTGVGSLDVALAGTALVTFDLPGLTLRGITELPLGTTVGWGSAMLEDGGYTYVYGTEGTADGMKFAHLARVPAGGLAGPWQFWTGSGWSTTESASARLMSGVGTSFGIQKVNGQYVVVTQETGLIFHPGFVAYTAATPTGAPTGLAATSDGTGNAHLSWQAPPGTGLQYWVYQRDVTAGQTHFARHPSSTAQTSADVGLLRDGHLYEFKVTAANTVGEGLASSVVTLTP